MDIHVHTCIHEIYDFFSWNFSLSLHGCLIIFVYFSELIYCGKKLQDSEPLEGAGLKAGATVFALKKFLAEKDDSHGNISFNHYIPMWDRKSVV